MMPTLITASTIKAALRDQRQGERYDVSDSRISGLQLRVKPQRVRWSVRVRLHGNQRRFDLGPAVEGDEDIEGLSLLTARARAMRITAARVRGEKCTRKEALRVCPGSCCFLTELSEHEAD